MKKLFFIVAAIGLMSMSSCMNGDYDANPVTSNSGPNPLNTGGNGGGGGGGSNSKFDWSGTDPFSAKVDGVPFQSSIVLYVPAFAGVSPASVTASGPNNTSIFVSIPDNATPNSVTNFASPVSASYSANTMSGNIGDVYGSGLGSGGAVQIIEIDATHVKGKFYFNGKSTDGGSKNITEGYFNVTK